MNFGFTLDPFGTVIDAIQSWDSSECTTEKECERSLAVKLETVLVEQKIEMQYGSGRQKIDILVDDKVPIEMKYNLSGESALQRLIGQLELYLRKWNEIVLVICGKVSPNILKDLRKYCEDKMTYPMHERVHIVIKRKQAGDV